MSSINRGFYVEVPPVPLGTRKRRTVGSAPSESPSATIEVVLVNQSRRKRRKITHILNTEGSSSNEKSESVNPSRSVSPSASDFEAQPLATHSNSNSGSRTLLQSSDGGEEEQTDEIPEPFVYSTVIDDVIEDEFAEVEGETPPDDAEDEDDIPIRQLDDFTLYNLETFEAVPLAQLMEIGISPTKFGASGLVNVWIENDDEDEFSDDEESEDMDRDIARVVPEKGEPERFTLSELKELSTISASPRRSFDCKIYVKTQYAWYILAQPSKEYQPFFRPFWVMHRILHVLLATSKDRNRLTYAEFTNEISLLDDLVDALVSSKKILGRPLNQQDVESFQTKLYIAARLEDLKVDGLVKSSRVPAIKAFASGSFELFEDRGGLDDEDEDSDQGSTFASSEGTPKPKKTVTQKKNQKLYGRTYLTPIVNRMSVDLFGGDLEVSRLEEEDMTSVAQLREHKAHHTNPDKIVWRKNLVEDEEVYQSVAVDGTVGDVVMVEPSNGSDEEDAAKTVNQYGNRWWFCQIRYFYYDTSRKEKMFHGQWFVHGCKTLLQETSHTQALYLLKGSCDSNLISSIFKKCNLIYLDPGDEEVTDGCGADSNDFHCGLMYDEDLYSFEDIPPIALAVEKDSGFKFCYACSLKDEDNLNSDVRTTANDDEVIVFGETYHVHDCVYVHPDPKSDSALLDIAQIVSVSRDRGKEGVLVEVRFLERYDNYVQAERERLRLSRHESDSELLSDERRLFMTNRFKKLSAKTIDGKCHVRYLADPDVVDQWVRYDDHFYFNQQGTVDELEAMRKRDFGYCGECREADKAQQNDKEKYLDTNSKLVGLELFAGAGGLGIGMDLSGFVETRYAVEFNASAAKTYALNHPDTIVYCQDSSKLLKHAVDVMNNKNPDALPSKDGKTLCPPMPKKSDGIDFIFGGPPCQSFSKANRHKDPDDIRSTMPANMLSYVEHYDPNYFLLENVHGFVEHKLYKKNRTTGELMEVQFGMVKYVARTLVALGYQVRWRLLQSGQYGVPQSRMRVIFWGSKRGLPLPEFPIPVYAFQSRMTRLYPPSGGHLERLTRSRDPESWHGFAPLKGITIEDAVGDLPPFEWKNPHKICAATPQQRKEAKQRRDELGIPEFNAESGHSDTTSFSKLPGFPRGSAYASEPQNRFQRWLRRGLTEDAEVSVHYTARWKAAIVEATCNIPLVPNAHHRSLSAKLRPYRRTETKQLILYGRLGPESAFKCAVTTMSPVSKNQWPLHPWLKRVYSVREVARAQGFPDSYIFESEDTLPQHIVRDQLKQIGNAVSVPFALALGKELGKAMMKTWKQKEREGSPVL
ncbi:S-adenosyl-L-methionine-dependent methyltransferase [Crepidotus variabilis]|uniref:Cytosine-specific methyltransferase n=1 Tax=Crepidotus variabilis TaxID=179855 RepID=A0A9P6JW63_9AGAR|nr:S-adenosyl-L-methionine-dependent methyltransferase [Crepidotus variabilis]